MFLSEGDTPMSETRIDVAAEVVEPETVPEAGTEATGGRPRSARWMCRCCGGWPTRPATRPGVDR